MVVIEQGRVLGEERRGERAIVSYSLIVMFMPCLETIKLRDNIRNDS